MSKPLSGKTVFVTGGTRGIGRAIALKCAQNGANVAVVARNAAGSTAIDAIRTAGAQVLAISCDIQYEDQVKAAVEQTAQKFGGIDVLVNNATVLVLKDTAEITLSEYDFMTNINTRGTFSVVKYALTYLQKSPNGHILTLCPMPQTDPQWFRKNLPYTMSKFSMGLMAFGLAEEQKPFGVASNTLWPFTTIDTDGLAECGNESLQACPRKPEIMADAAFWIMTQDSRVFSGNFCVDEIVLREAGFTSFEQYNSVADAKLSDLSRDHMVSQEQYARLMRLRELSEAADTKYQADTS
ncbi:Hydroxysteroid dehydrogenase-like protein 2 [Coemansia sp. Benny D160-2]|nr:Hydroxysteroid dehydrogenase-like protein 2 [Coemansia sp. Benny D160-2]